MSKKRRLLYLLQSQKNNKLTGMLGILTSMKELEKAVDFWVKEIPDETLVYIVFEANKPDPDGWDWGYIAPNSIAKKLGAGGGPVPPKEFWGINLITNEKAYSKKMCEANPEDIYFD